jgi:hypothetical protein
LFFFGEIRPGRERDDAEPAVDDQRVLLNG